MNAQRLAFLLIVLFMGYPCLVNAQLPVLETQWSGTLLLQSATPVQLSFHTDTLLIKPVPTGQLLRLRYRQMGDTLVFQSINGAFSCPNQNQAFYRLVYVRNGEGFYLKSLQDDCPDRRKAFSEAIPFSLLPPNSNYTPRHWPYLDPQTDSVAGISLYRAYELLKGRKSVPVVVGVLDSGVDITHEDLRDVIWKNPNEIAHNQVDEDKNGYTDDVHGWNFMGTKEGITYEYDQPEITQTYVLLKAKYDTADPARLTPSEKRQYDTYQRAKKQFLSHYKTNWPKHLALSDTATFWRVATQIRTQLPDSVTSARTIRQVPVGSDSVAVAVQTLLADAYRPSYGPFGYYLMLVRQNWNRFRQVMGGEADIAYNPNYNARQGVGDDPANPNERYYGSPTMQLGQSQQLAVHGSHVAGIIGATRTNGKGIDGVADHVRIMPVWVVPANGDERDKDVANGIRYAVENGAKVINMSFGKRLSPFKEQVDAAIRFAEAHDVLLVHAAGNNGENIDSVPAFPSARYENGQMAQNVLVVGNSTWKLNENLASRSSNYGPEMVDLFAPGTTILSTIPHNGYASFSGTSMAAPMTAGVAALLRSYFPKLTAVQVKEILMKSSYKPDLLVHKPGRSAAMVPFRSLSRSGGLLNAYEAVKMILADRRLSKFK